MKLENVRILAGKSLLWDDIALYYKRKVDREDYIMMHVIDHDTLKRLSSTKPFFSDQYIVELHLSKVTGRLLNQLMKYIKSEWITFIFVCTTKEDFDILSNVATKSFNGYKISKEYWLGYVKSRLTCSPRVNLENIYKALAGRFELTELVIDVVNKTNGHCTLKQVTKLIGKRDKMSLDLVWFSVLRMDQRAKKDVFKYLEEYRYGYNFIVNAMEDKYEELLAYYKDFNDGKLNELNMREYKKESHKSEWLLKTYIGLFSNMSYDEILLIGEMIQCSEVNSSAKMFELIGRLYNRKTIEFKVV